MKDALLRDGVVQISIVIPVWNEEKENIRELYLRLTKVLISLERTYEIIFVDDGSRDETFDVLRSLHQIDGQVKIIRLARNFGQAVASSAGLEYANGEIIVTIDSDLQYLPEDIPKLIKKIDNGFDVVAGWRKKRYNTSLARRMPSNLINALARIRLKADIHDYGCSFNAIKKNVVAQLKSYGKRRRFIKPLAVTLTDSIAEIKIECHPRKKGRSGYGLFKLLKLGLDCLTNFSTRPLREAKPLFIVREIIN